MSNAIRGTTLADSTQSRCPQCSTSARPTDRYCSQCGTNLGADSVPGATRIDFARFFELAVDVFVVTGPDGKFALVNEALARLLGVDRSVILASPWSEFVHPDDRERSAAEAAREFGLGHRTITFENRYVDTAGGIHWMDWSAELDPASGFVYGIARDVTAQKTAHATLNAAHAVAEDARAAAEAANRAKSEYLSRMSHELRTPLNAVLGFAQLLELDGLKAEHAEYVQHILRGGRHLLGLIDEVLDISRIESGAVTISVEPVHVTELVAEVMSLLGPLAAARRITLRSSVGEDHAAHVMADRQRLRQILVNYLSNAIKYTPPGSTATISAVPAGEHWTRIAVADDGPGIGDELLGRLFTPFDRIGAEQTAVEGTGLGLAHSKALAERMGGRVGVDSAIGRGSTFWVELPVADRQRVAEPAAVVARTGAARAAAVGTIVYVEDNPSNLRLVERALAQRPGIGLRTAVQGRAGLELIRQTRPDLVVLDLHLPDMGGEEILSELRGDPGMTEIPVIILSADATRRQIDHLLAIGAQAYLTKPLDVGAFLSVVDEHLGQATDSPTSR